MRVNSNSFFAKTNRKTQKMSVIIIYGNKKYRKVLFPEQRSLKLNVNVLAFSKLT